MSSCKDLKRLFELESNAPGQQEASNNETVDRAEPKRQRAALGCAGDNFEEFVALLDRIQYMKTKHKDLAIWEAEDLDVKVIKTKSPWIPSFECTPPKENPSSSEEKGKQSIQPANHLKTTSFPRNAYDNCAAESFDLNVEATS